MAKIVLYTIGCPKCTVLERKLDAKHITYEKCEDLSKMLELGFQTAPVLDVDGEIYEFSAANKLINEMKAED